MFYKLIFVLCLFFSNLSNAFEIGVATHFTRYPEKPSYYIGLIKEQSFTSFRDGFSWSSIEKEPGKFEISQRNSALDNMYRNDNSYIIKNSMFVLAYGNEIYTGTGYPSSREEVDKFVEYVAWVVNRYKGKIKYYEIWNEWFLGAGMSKKQKIPSDAVFLYLVQQTAKKIKSIDPNAIVITGSVNPIHEDEAKWMQGLIRNGLGTYVDGISIHPYSFSERDRSLRKPIVNIEKIDLFEEELRNIAGKEVPLYITEMGFPSSPYVPGGVTIDKASDYVLQYTLLARSREFIKGIWWYDLIDDGDDPTNKEHNFGFYNKKNSPKIIPSILNRVETILSNRKYFFKHYKDIIEVSYYDDKGIEKIKYVWNVNDSFTYNKFVDDIKIP